MYGGWYDVKDEIALLRESEWTDWGNEVSPRKVSSDGEVRGRCLIL